LSWHFAPIDLWASVGETSVRYLFGNGSLNFEDQRWRGASNLR
jgi:hypothetical protein